METEEILNTVKQNMQKSVEHVSNEFNSLHTGKANTSMVESITVDVYGSNMNLRDVAAITIPDARTVQIQPWDKSTTTPIEKALIEGSEKALSFSGLTTGVIFKLYFIAKSKSL